jgi:hypothetical protein
MGKLGSLLNVEERVHKDLGDLPSIHAAGSYVGGAIVEQEELRRILQGYGGIDPRGYAHPPALRKCLHYRMIHLQFPQTMPKKLFRSNHYHALACMKSQQPKAFQLHTDL